ncbi:hypothetical protein SETIT_6G176700v2 [Setaria italica]|uniref:Cytochrome P450 n=1 Tax=Setaria italica TaxID=4555 RepID=A0A368RMP2_SETIT|nr:hypothetical protein SETIT_6G176700v2 [Setaria italica]
MESELWLLWATLVVSLLYYLSSLRRGTGTPRLPPGPRPLPLVGNLLDLRGHLHHTLARLARVHGPVMRLKLGLTTAVVVSSRGAAREAFARHDRRLAARAVPDAARALRFSDRSMIWLPSSDPRWKPCAASWPRTSSPRAGLAAARGVRERKVTHGDFLDALLELLSAGKVARDNLTTILFDVFVAGSDTIAITVEWAMAELLRNPSIMAKVRMELDGVLGDKETVQEPDVASLPYLQAVVKEAMRLHPVAPILLPHQAVEDGVEIGGYMVPKGSTVIFNAWAIMRDPELWERPEEFVPERFLDEAASVELRAKDFEFIPFGAGRRLCPGLPMAERVVPHIVASLLHGFDWRLPEGVSNEQLDLSEKFTTVNVLVVPLRAVPVMRT